METIYANINFKKKQRERQKRDEETTKVNFESDSVIYSQIQPQQSGDRNQQKTSSESNTGDSVVTAENVAVELPVKPKSMGVAKAKFMAVLLILCAFLLTSVVVGVLYYMTLVDSKILTETKNNMTDELQNLIDEKKQLEKQLSETKNNMTDELQNLTDEKKQLEQKLAETQFNLTDHLLSSSRMKEELHQRLAEMEQHHKSLTTDKQTLEKLIDDTCRSKSELCCDPDHQYHSLKCYYLYNDRQTWSDSRKKCQLNQGDLAMFKSKQTFLKIVHAGHYWIGLTDSETEGDWRWLDNTPLNITPRYWAGDEPDNWKGKNGENLHGEDCAVLNLPINGLLDNACNLKQRYICEFKIFRTLGTRKT